MKTFVSLLLLIMFSSTVFSQEKRDELDPTFILEKSPCFMNSNYLQGIEISSESNDLIIIISHLSKSERLNMADRRLYNARTFLLTNSVKPRPVQKIITAKGEKSTERGYLDFFIKGRLELRIYFRKNEELYVQPCFEDPEQKPCTGPKGRLYYPCKKD